MSQASIEATTGLSSSIWSKAGGGGDVIGRGPKAKSVRR